MTGEDTLRNLPSWIQRTSLVLKRMKAPGRVVSGLISIIAILWFLVRVVPKPTRAAYPCMQVALPFMSGAVMWVLSAAGIVGAFNQLKRTLQAAQYTISFLFLLMGTSGAFFLSTRFSSEANANGLEVWYKPNVPLGVARGTFPGRVAWGHNPRIASWDGVTGFWWEDKFNNQAETEKLLSQTLSSLTGEQTEKESWNVLFSYFNLRRHNQAHGYQPGKKVAIKINENNTDAHENTKEINANPQLILTLLTSLIKQAGVPEDRITVADPSRFITDNIYDKCHAVFPRVHFVDHNGGNGREKATFTENAILYSAEYGKTAQGLASCVTGADYIINLAIMKGHESQGITLCAKNFFGCTNIETDWHKNSHSSGFSQNREGRRTYSVYPDYMGHKDLGEKTILFLIDGIYSNKFVHGAPAYKWALAPFNNHWPCSLFASQDGVAIESVALDFMLAEWPDAPDMKYSDYYLEESALADNPPSGTVYDPEHTGTRLKSLGVTEHWNNSTDKQYSRNLKTGHGIELIYSLIGK